MDFLQEELDEILNIFQQEGAEILQSMDKNLLLLEKKPDNLDVAMHLFRDAHSLKGSARMLGFDDIQNIAHKIEDVLGLIRENKLKANSNITDTISSALNCINNLIRKTVENKAEYKSEETQTHIQRLVNLCKIETENKEENELEEKKFEQEYKKFEDFIGGLIFIYSKSVQEKDFDQFEDILNILSEMTLLSSETNFRELGSETALLSDFISKNMAQNNFTEEILHEINLKIINIIQIFNKVASEKNKPEIDYNSKIANFLKFYDSQNKEDKTSQNAENSEEKNAEIADLINKTIETMPEINKNKHSLAEIKSLLNEIVLRANNTEFRKIYENFISIILMCEKNNAKIQSDAIDALIEILEECANILDIKESKNIYEEFGEEIDLLNQKAVVVKQMVKYEIKNPSKYSRTQKQTKPIEWVQDFDSPSIKTLRVNSDKLDKLVNQIGNLIVSRIKSNEHTGVVKYIQDELVEWQKHCHKIGYYMKFYEKKYLQEIVEDAKNSDLRQKKDSFLGYNRQLIGFHNSNSEKINDILNNLNTLMKELQENNIKLSTTTSEIENMVKSMRILPLSTVFNLFPRMVHNIAKDKGKEIELIIEGQEVSADKKIIEDIKIPIMHIIRNSIDHGIETPREREKAGKPKVGSIVIKASQKENKIIISVKDDGRGINIAKIKQKAIEKGLITQEASENMTKEQLANFIFYPGFSTGDTVTELSGRGLGLDIVHTKISQLNGRIDVYSEENKGTVVTMELPTTMATLKTFIIMENNQLFAIPTNSIETVLRVSYSEIKTRDDRNYLIYNNEAIPICSLSSILGYKELEETPNKLIIMVIKAEGITTGVIVQKLMGDEEILHKRLPEPMLRVKNISGITTLANGEMCLLLNVGDILSSNKVNPNRLTSTKSLTFQDNSKYKILVVDDSITTRRLLGNVLMSGGYTVDTQASANDALFALETNKYDLIVSDYDMPELNGLDFVRILRSKAQTKTIPIIIITTSNKQGLKEQFFKLGIQEYVKKSYFEQQSFIKMVDKHLNSL